MKVCLIPPKGMEELALESNCHLMLAIPELLKRVMYEDTYIRARVRGDFIIVDNGVNEGQAAQPTALLRTAQKYNADELVLPDVMEDAARTKIAVAKFFSENNIFDFQGKYMCVVQGQDDDTLKRMVEWCTSDDRIVTLGLPRHLLKTTQNKQVRIDLANWISGTFGSRFNIHFLGASPLWLGEVWAAAKYTPTRSLDTSLPFYWAFEGMRLDRRLSSVFLERPKNYFKRDRSQETKRQILIHNINTFKSWANSVAQTSPR